MENEPLFYQLPRHLNKGKTLVGLPRDEVLPAFLIWLLFFLAESQFIGFVLGAIWFIGLRYIKVQFGDNIIALSMYWWGSADINKTFFKHTPASEQRYWLR